MSNLDDYLRRFAQLGTDRNRTRWPVLARSMPHATAVELPGLNHSAPEEAAAPVIAARVRQFLVDHQPQDGKVSN